MSAAGMRLMPVAVWRMEPIARICTPKPPTQKRKAKMLERNRPERP